MSATLDWSWVFVMDPTLYSQLKNYIFSNILPTTIYNVQCNGNMDHSIDVQLYPVQGGR